MLANCVIFIMIFTACQGRKHALPHDTVEITKWCGKERVKKKVKGERGKGKGER